MAAATIENFTPLSEHVSLYSSTSSQETAHSPSLIVICSWMGAVPKHIAKYTQGYERHFPGADILLIQSTVSDVFSGDTRQQNRLYAACDLVSSYATSETDRGPIFLHAFSNGGGTTAAHLIMLYKAQRGPLPFDKMIFDCLPGKPIVSQAVRAIAVGLPRTLFIRTLGSIVMRVLLTLYLWVVWFLRTEDVLTRMRRRLNDPELFGQGGAHTRLYMYSRADQMVEADHVREHIDEAKSRGWAVREEVFQKSQHCALAMGEPERYWETVLQFGQPAGG